ncbi:MAG: thiamine-phosphate kinase [Lysobacteraceae bacterium]
MAEPLGEFDLIECIRRRIGAQADVVLGIGDDAAIVTPLPDRQLVVCTDTLVKGVHYPPETRAADVGWKSLAVNLSDLAAMGARPRWVTLALTMPESSGGWLEEFLDGFLELAVTHGVALVGGDTTRGPESITVTAFGSVPPDQALRRDAAQLGDDLWVTGTLGDAALALQHWRETGRIDNDLLAARLNRPTPRIAFGLALRGIAHAAIDVSDGLLADAGHVARASSLGIELHTDALPASDELAAMSALARQGLQLAGGDDYELCFSAPVEKASQVQSVAAACDVRVTRIGRLVDGSGMRVLGPGGQVLSLSEQGYRHFAS